MDPANYLPPFLIPQIEKDLIPLLFSISLSRRPSDASLGSPTEDELLSMLDPDSRAYKVVDIEGKGKGVIPTRNVSRGEMIVQERPLAIWRRRGRSGGDEEVIKKMIKDMDETCQLVFWDLSNRIQADEQTSPPTEKSEQLEANLPGRILAANAFNVQLPPLEKDEHFCVSSSLAREVQIKHDSSDESSSPPTHASFLFPRIARFNHSCLPNADHAIDFKDLSMTVYATTDITTSSAESSSNGDGIGEMEEICIEYLPGLLRFPTLERQAKLKEAFGFTCRCSLCSLSLRAASLETQSDTRYDDDDDWARKKQAEKLRQRIKDSDERRKKIGTLVDMVSENIGNSSEDGKAERRRKIFASFTTIWDLMKEEGYYGMPEFEHPQFNESFKVFMVMKSRQSKESNQG